MWCEWQLITLRWQRMNCGVTNDGHALIWGNRYFLVFRVFSFRTDSTQLSSIFLYLFFCSIHETSFISSFLSTYSSFSFFRLWLFLSSLKCIFNLSFLLFFLFLLIISCSSFLLSTSYYSSSHKVPSLLFLQITFSPSSFQCWSWLRSITLVVISSWV